MTFYSLHTVICIRMTCYFSVHKKYKSSFHLGKAVRDSTVQSSLNWHGKWKGRRERPEEAVWCCLVTAAAAAIPQEVSLAKVERGGLPSTALTLAVLQTCLQGVRAKECVAQERLRHCSSESQTVTAFALDNNPLDLVLPLTGLTWRRWASKHVSNPWSQPSFIAAWVHHDFLIAVSIRYRMLTKWRISGYHLASAANVRHNSRPDTDVHFRQNSTTDFAPHL